MIAADPVFEPGTVRLLSDHDGIGVWQGMRAGSDDICGAIDARGRYEVGCVTPELYAEQGLNVHLLTEPDEHGNDNHNAVIMSSLSGDPLAYAFSFSVGEGMSGWLAQFSEDERAMAEQLLAAGYDDYSPQAVGYFDQVPVWTAMRDFNAEMCLIVPGSGGGEVCAPSQEVPADGLSLTTFVSTGAEDTRVHTFRLAVSERWSPTLTIETLPGVTADGAAR